MPLDVIIDGVIGERQLPNGAVSLAISRLHLV